MHPHHFSLTLLKTLIDHAPQAFPKERRDAMFTIHQKFLANEATSHNEIDTIFREFGKEIWPFSKAFDEMFHRYGKASEAKHIRQELPSEIVARYENFLRDGGNLEDFRHGSLTEEYFSAEEKFALGQAELSAHDLVTQEINALTLGDKKQEFDELVTEFTSRRDAIIEKINVLQGLAQRGKKWKDEIRERAHVFEDGFAFLEKPFTATDVQGAIDYYLGAIELTDEEIVVADQQP